jgi:4-hydroxybenzoate polyprenyltransferase
MATARTLNVLMGAGADHIPAALPAAMVVGGHTAVVTRASRSEVSGATERTGAEALAGTGGVAAAAAALVLGRRRARRPARLLAALGLLGAYASVQGKAARVARAEPTPANVQGFVGSGVMGFIPLDAAMLTATAPSPIAVSVAASWPIARKLARRRSPT